MERTLKELEKVRTSPEPDAVHDLRVALAAVPLGGGGDGRGGPRPVVAGDA